MIETWQWVTAITAVTHCQVSITWTHWINYTGLCKGNWVCNVLSLTLKDGFCWSPSHLRLWFYTFIRWNPYKKILQFWNCNNCSQLWYFGRSNCSLLQLYSTLTAIFFRKGRHKFKQHVELMFTCPLKERGEDDTPWSVSPVFHLSCACVHPPPGVSHLSPLSPVYF